ncbi:MAG: REP-associated tyrosine transposase [Candidatus Binatia bacterium]
MARKPRVFAPGVLYHVIVRGNQRQKTFLKAFDYEVYVEKLAQYRRRYKVTIYAYCLMPNHVHLLLECSRTPLARFMQGLQQSYTQYFNRTYNKVGHLFQGRYKAILCQKEAYLLELVRYIHLNPVRSKLVRSAERYSYSGEQAYWKGKPSAVLDCGPVLKMIGGRAGYRRFVQEGLGDGHKEEYYAVEDQRFLGGEAFGQAMRREIEDDAVQPRKMRPIGAVVADLARALKVAPEMLRAASHGWDISRKRTQAAYVLVRRCGFKVNDVAMYFGRDSTTLSSLLSRYENKLQQQPALGRDVERLAQFV